jgi:hypothetical protein
VSAIPPDPAAASSFVAAAPAIRMSAVRLQPIGVPRAANAPRNMTMSPNIEHASTPTPRTSQPIRPPRRRLSVGPRPTIRGAT